MDLLDDARLALRSLRRGGVPVLVVATLAVGLACTTAMFSVVKGVLLEPLPWPEAERLAVVWNRPPGVAEPISLSQREVVDLRERLDGVAVGSYSTQTIPIRLGDREETFEVTFATREVMEILGRAPFLGRGLAADEFDRDGPRTLLLAYETWQRLYAGDPAALGKTLVVRGRPHEVVGVMPPDVPLPLEVGSGSRTELWIGSDLRYAEEWPRETRMFPALARLGEGTTLEAARGKLAQALAELRRQHPESYAEGWRMELVPVEEEVLGGIRPTLLALFGAVGLVLLLVCANVAHLLLAQAEARRGEIAVRLALGAARAQIVRGLLLESLTLALAGGALGALGAYAAVDALRRLAPGELPRIDAVEVDGPVLLFALAVALATPLLFGLAPALGAARADLGGTLHGQRGGAGGLRVAGARRLLVVGEVALATVLLAGAVLLVATLRQLARADLGFAPAGLTLAAVSAPVGPEVDTRGMIAFWDALRARAEALPGAEAASVTMAVPLHGTVMSRALEVEGEGTPGSAAPGLPRATIHRAAPRISETMGTRVVLGRDLEEGDDADAPLVALVNETLAAHLGPEPIGRRLRIAERGAEWLRVVGVVADVVGETIDGPVAPRIVVPYAQLEPAGGRMQGFMWLALRTAPGAAPTLGELRRLVHGVDRGASVVTRLDAAGDVVAAATAGRRFAAFVLGLFAAVAVALAVVGVYGLLAYLVRRGRRELAVRMAIGARRQDVHRLVSRQGFVLAAAGLALGLPAALLVTRLLGSLLYGVAATEPRAFAATALVLLGAAVAAGLVPAHRATRIEPVEILRSE